MAAGCLGLKETRKSMNFLVLNFGIFIISFALTLVSLSTYLDSNDYLSRIQVGLSTLTNPKFPTATSSKLAQQREEQWHAEEPKNRRLKDSARDTVRTYYAAMERNDLGTTQRLRMNVRNYAVFKDGVLNCAQAEIIDLDKNVGLNYDGGLLSAVVGVRVRVKQQRGRAEIWGGSVILQRVGQTWKIRKLDLNRQG